METGDNGYRCCNPLPIPQHNPLDLEGRGLREKLPLFRGRRDSLKRIKNKH